MITLKKAIEILTVWHDDPHQFHNPDYPEAVKLLIEAGKVLQHQRALHTYPAWKLLPGETEE